MSFNGNKSEKELLRSENMEQTDKLFNAFLRMLMGRIETVDELLEKEECEEAKEVLEEIFDDLQKSLED